MKRGIDYIGVGVGAIIINDEEKYLLAKRGKKAKNEKGKWEFPGGTIEFGDTLKETIIREIKEELDIEIDPQYQLPSIDHLIPEEKQHWVTNAFISKIVKGKPKILEPEKCSEIGWFDMKEIEKMDLSIATIKYFLHLKTLDLNKII